MSRHLSLIVVVLACVGLAVTGTTQLCSSSHAMAVIDMQLLAYNHDSGCSTLNSLIHVILQVLLRCFDATGAQSASTTSAVATQRKLLGSQGLFDGLNAAKKVGDALGSQVSHMIARCDTLPWFLSCIRQPICVASTWKQHGLLPHTCAAHACVHVLVTASTV